MQPSPTLPLIALAPLHLDRTAIIAEQGRLTYRDLLDQSARTATTLLDGADDLIASSENWYEIIGVKDNRTLTANAQFPTADADPPSVAP